MPKIKSLVIPIRKIEFSETSLITALFTRDHGRVDCIFKGARKLNLKNLQFLDLFNIYEVIYLEKNARPSPDHDTHLHLLSEAKLTEHFPGLHNDLKKYYAAMSALEIIREIVQDNQPCPPLFDSFVFLLRSLSSAQNYSLLLSNFKCKALLWLGQSPNLSSCSACGKALVKTPAKVAFSHREGGILCSQCKAGKRHDGEMTGPALSLMARLMTYSDTELHAIRPTPEHQIELGHWLDGYFQYLFDKRFLKRPEWV